LTAREALAQTEGELAAAGVPSPRVDAEHLVSHSLGVPRTAVYVDLDRALDAPERRRLGDLVARRRMREPLAYVLGNWGFRRLTLTVDRRVLVPRPETEVVVERCLDLIHALDTPSVLDVGTGSGAIALAIADEHPGARVSGIDVSAEALEVATENALRLGLNVGFGQHDLALGLRGRAYDLVVSNPPYVGENELGALEPEVRDWEPTDALVDRGQTAAIVGGAPAVLRPGGWLVLEAHEQHAEDVVRLIAASGYRPPRISTDLAGRQRVVEAQWGS